MVLTAAQKLERAQTIKYQLVANDTKLQHVENLVNQTAGAENTSKSIIDLILAKIREVDDTHKTLLPLLFDVISGDDAAEAIECAGEIELRIQSVQLGICSLVDKLPLPVTSGGESGNSNATQHLPKLPNMQIPQFGGAVEEWEQFKETFVALIDSRTDLDEFNKLRYLKSYCTGEAAQLIGDLKITAVNYKEALKILETSYERKPLIVNKLINKLLNMQAMGKPTASEILRIILKTNSIILNLKAADQTQNSLSNALIVEIISAKLDGKIREAWEADKPTESVPTWDELSAFLEKAKRIKEQLESHKELLKEPIEEKHPRRNRSLYTNTLCCPVCAQQHKIYVCEEFKQLALVDREELVRKRGLCYKCLNSTNHNAKDCVSNYGCNRCNRRHHRLLHPESEITPNYKSEERTSTNMTTLNSQSTQEVLLATAMVHIIDRDGMRHTCRAIIDTASHSSFITAKLANRTKLKGKNFEMNTTGLGGVVTATVCKSINAQIGSRINNTTEKVELMVIKEITGPLPTKSFSTNDWKIPNTIRLADPSFSVSNPIDLLLGADMFFKFIKPGMLRINQATFINTELGYLVGGNTATGSHVNLFTRENHSMTKVSNESLNQQLEKFFALEGGDELRYDDKTEEDQCEAHFTATYHRKNNGQYVVQIPIKTNPPILGNTFNAAEKQLHQLLKRLEKNPIMSTLYKQFMKEYEDLHHMEEIPERSDMSKFGLLTSYLPHHGVLKTSSVPNKIRVVFNASQPSTSGTSINDMMMNGGIVQPTLIQVFLRFRLPIHVFCTDITKMYRMIEVHETNQNMQLILWKPNLEERTKVFRLKTVTYGTVAAPFLATRVLNQLAADEQHRFPLASAALLNNTYVDDIMAGCDSLKDVQNLQNELVNILGSAQMALHKWSSNTPALLHTIEQDNLEPPVSINEKFNAVVKTLGMTWDPAQDLFTFKISLTNDTRPSTKRSVLSQISSIFDPLGLLAPVIVTVKLFMQHLWKQKMSWDEPLSPTDDEHWKILKTSLKDIELLTINRCIKPTSCTTLELHGFSDASSIAYGACIYLVTKGTANTPNKSTLVIAKSRVGPIQPLTIPRMELQAAVMLAKLMDQTLHSLPVRMSRIICYSDSTIVLAWIKTPHENLKMYCANRILQIQKLTKQMEWQYVNTKENPADIVSRGCSAAQLKDHKLWFQGPARILLPSPNHQMINYQDVFEQSEFQRELKPIMSTSLLTTGYHDNFEKLIYSKSNFRKLQRVVGYLLRFIHNAKLKIQRNKGLEGLSPSPKNQPPLILTAAERRQALLAITKYVQHQEFPSQIKKLKAGQSLANDKLKNLSLILDNEGILRVGGRLQHLNTDDVDKKFPMLLPKNHHLTKIVIYTFHTEEMHIGQQGLLAFIRQTFWPINGKQLVKRIVHSCITCFKNRPTTEFQQMAALPTARTTAGFPFEQAGVDFGGPFIIKDGHGRTQKTKKVYIAIFVCFTTKAVHIELVHQLTSSDFIATLKRFFSRRGQSAVIHSDNATNFRGADAETAKLVKQFNDQQNQAQIVEFCAERGTSWKFIPPRSPHFGGIWEAAIKSTKFHMKRVIGNATLTFEELNTIVIQIEAILNSRPLMELSTDPNDSSALTPAHFLIGRPLSSMPEPDLTLIKESRLDKWQRVQAIYQSFWKRWYKEYLSTLHQRKKWNGAPRIFKLNQIVIVKDENTPALRWKLGRITKLHPGPDGLVRVVSLKLQHGNADRAITRICVLPFAENLG